MSLILDALRKADRERQQQQHSVPGIDATHSLAEAPAVKLWPWMVAITILVLVLLAAVIWLLLDRNEPGVTATAAPAHVLSKQATASQATASQIASPQTLTGDAAEDAAISETAINKAVQSQSTVSSQARSSASANQLPVTEPTKVNKPSVDDEVAQLYRAPPPDEPPVTVATRPPVTAVTTATAVTEIAKPAATTAPVRETLLAGHPNVGTIRDLPLAVQNEIPTLMYAVHNFKPAGESEVMINNQTLRVGQKLGNLTLEIITEDGVIMRKGEHRFTLTALSSWVNM